MVKKRKKKVKKVKRKPAKTKARRKKPVKTVRYTKRKLSLVVKNLIVFLILFLAAYFLKNVSNNEIFQMFFTLLTIILGFVAFAFVVVLLILLILRWMEK